jgi:hypothetical protein
MPNPNMTSPTGSNQNPLPDTQMLITLLSSLMPLLQRMQSHMEITTLPSFGAGNFSYENFARGSFGQGNAVAQNPLIDQQAAVSFVEDITADTLRNLSAYLDAYAEQYSELDRCVTLVTQAARCFAARDYNQCFELIWQAYRVIAAARSMNPQLPSLRTAAQAGASFTPSTTLAH